MLCALGCASPAWAIAPVAGTEIDNTASATFVDAASGISVHQDSNTVAVIVQPLEACTLTPGQVIVRAPNTGFALPHMVGNAGNTDETCLLDLAMVAGANYNPNNLEVVQDLNGNGVVDPGEPILVPTGSVTMAVHANATAAASNGITLAPGASAAVLVVGTVPATALPGQSASMTLGATSANQGQRATAVDTVQVSGGPALNVTKAASTAAPTQGGTVTYTLAVSNQGDSAAPGASVLVDGANQNLLLLRDAIPANTTFQSLGAAGSAVQLYHRVGDPVATWQTTQPSATTIDAIAWGMPSLAAGAALTGQFTVVVNANASGALDNTAYSDFQGAGLITVPSNPVHLPLPTVPGQISFYPPAYGNPIQQSPLTDPLYVQINAGACNIDSSLVQTFPVRLASQLTGDLETFIAVETGANTGIFRIQPDVPTADARSHIVASGDGTVEILPNDLVTATMLGCSAVGEISSLVLIDPQGVVFDSKTNATVPGSTVTLIDVTGAGNGGHPGSPATVFAADGSTPAPSVVVTGGDGVFSFPAVLPSTYALKVVPPAGYLFPSKLPPALQPAGRTVVDPGSYGGSFVVSGKGPIRIDVPLDPGATGGLMVQKSASQSVVEVGDFLDYTITVGNRSGIALPDVQVSDWLPVGFEYVKGSARLQGHAIADPVRNGGVLGFSLGTIANAHDAVLTYRVAVAPGALAGNGINSAQAQSGTLRSNLASVKVRVIGGVFTEQAILIGRIFADCDADRVQGKDEPGVPGVRIWLADGTYAITDGDGKYSLYGLTPRTTVAAVDPSTLPEGATLEVLDHRNAFEPSSQFVDLQKGELHKTDFAIRECTSAIRSQLAARRKAQAKPDEIVETAQSLPSTTTNTSSFNTDARALPASGTLGPNGVVATGTAIAQQGSLLGAVGDFGGSVAQQSPAAKPLFPGLPVQQAQVRDPASSAQVPVNVRTPVDDAKAATDVPLKDLVSKMDGKVEFLDLTDGQVMPTAQLRLRVKGPYGATLRLTVNDAVVSDRQVGIRSSLQSKGVTAWEYVGVDLKPGLNQLVVTAIDPFGGTRGQASIRLRAPGAIAALRFVLPAKAVADAQTRVLVSVQPVDADGLPVTTRLPVTLDTSEGAWQANDLNPSEPGTQVFVEGGSSEFALLPPAHPGTALLTAKSGTIDGDAKLTFSPDLRPLFGVGLVEGVLNLRKLDAHSVSPVSGSDAFERQITSLSRSFNDGKDSAAARTQVFLKGKVLGSTLLTLGYDSDKPSDTQLFRDIQPNRYYPIYGDSSIKGFDAQSTGKLYVRLDHGTSYVLLGDYTSQTENPARQLSQYTRALYGMKAHGHDGGLTVDGFASHTSSAQTVVEIPANGTSGPYQLDLNGVVNSQQVDLLVRDRNQPGVVLSVQPMTPFVDYSIEIYTGRLLFAAPISAVDENLNPVFIRVTYEVNTGGPQHWVGGLSAEYQFGRAFALGGTAIRDDDPAKRLDLFGIDFTAHLGAKSTLVGEFARSDSADHGTGNAERFEWKGQGEHVQGRVWGIHTDTDFYNPSALQSAGQSQYGAQVGWLISQKDRIAIEGLRTESQQANGNQTGASITLQHSLPGGMKLSVGIRHASGNAQTSVPHSTTALPASTPVDFTSGFVRLDAPVPGFPKANLFAQYERAFNESAQVASIGGTYAISDIGKLYFNHESNNSLSGAFGLNPNVNQYSTVFGFQSTLSGQTQLFNEYRIGQGIDGRAAEDAIGLRRTWQVSPGLGVSASAERIHPTAGKVSDESQAVTGAISYTASDNLKASARLEWRDSLQSTGWLATGAVAAKLDNNWTLLARGFYNVTNERGTSTGSQRIGELQTGFAYRPADSNVWNALGMLGYKRNQDSTLPFGQQLDQRAWILLTQVDVQPSDRWNLSARFAAKHTDDAANGINSSGWTGLLGGRVTRDFGEHWDAGVQGFTSWGFGTRRDAAGAELGYLFRRNLWLSLGYNVVGFDDPDLAGGAYTQDGFYLRLRFKFGADLFEKAGAMPVPQTDQSNAAAGIWNGASTGTDNHAP